MKKLNRYAGVAPFAPEQKEVFFGRENDIEKLSNLVLQEQQVLLYAKSGLGKSSLINAGLLPRLQTTHSIVPIMVRFMSYTEQKKETLMDTLLQSLPTHQPNTFLDIVIAQENSLWYHMKALQAENNVAYLLVFDQFEELFTYPEEQIFAFKKQMADMLYRAVPQTFKKVLEKKQATTPDLLSVSEFQLLHQKMSVKVLMAIREDKYSLLNMLTDYLPDVMHYRYGLEPLSTAQATQAIVLPAQQVGEFRYAPFSYTPEALDKILAFLTNEGTQAIETTQLQILCNRIENLGKNLVKSENIPNFDNIFLEFYYDTLAQVPDSERVATQRFIENELVRKEQRVSLDKLICLDTLKGETLDLLVNLHLLRAERNTTGGTSYEIAHDTLISPIVEAKTTRENQEAQEKAEKDRIEEEKRLREQAERDRQEKLKAQRQLRNTRLLLAGAVLGLLIAVVAVFWAYNEQRKAIKSKNEAVELQKVAVKAKENAEQMKQVAESEKQKAENALNDLEAQMGLTKSEQVKRAEAEKQKEREKERNELSEILGRIDRLPKGEIQTGIQELQNLLQQNKYPHSTSEIQQKIIQLQQK